MFDSYAQIFAERGAAYHAAMAMCEDARAAEFVTVLEPLRDRSSGLLCDMPSGGGYLAAHIPRHMRYIGIDPADDFIDACFDSVERIKADIFSVPLGDGSVDYIVSLAALHHEPDLAGVFREMRRLLKPGGRAVIADAAADTPVAAFLNGFVDRNNPMGHKGRFLDNSVSALLHDAGFTIGEDRVLSMPWTFSSLEEAGAFCRLLFWMPELRAEAVAEAMHHEIGFSRVGEKLELDWRLRRIVCDC